MRGKPNRGLDMLNFFLAAVQTGFGPFVAIYLASQGWSEVEIGMALSIGTIAMLISQIPGGAIVDVISNKRTTIALGIMGITLSALMLALSPMYASTILALILQAVASCVISPSIVAVSLLMVGSAAVGTRLGRNSRFAAIGNGAAAAAMGGIGALFSTRWVFMFTAMLAVPALASLLVIKIGRLALASKKPEPFLRCAWGMLHDRRLLIFAICVLFFHLSNGAMLTLAGIEMAKDNSQLANMVIAICVIIPSIITVILSQWVGVKADKWGRRPLLLLGWVALPVRGSMLVLFSGPWLLASGQIISGVSAAVFGVMLPLIATDISRKSGSLNLCLGLLGFTCAVGGMFSISIAGLLATTLGSQTAFMALTLVGLVATLLLWILMPETK